MVLVPVDALLAASGWASRSGAALVEPTGDVVSEPSERINRVAFIADRIRMRSRANVRQSDLRATCVAAIAAG